MASEYDSLLEETPKTSEYDALLAPEQHEERSIPSKVGHAVLDTLKGFLPQSVQEAALAPVTMVPGIGHVGKILSNIALGKPIEEGTSPIQGIPVVQRIPQLIEAEKTPAYSQERFTTGAGVVADLAMLAGLKSALHPKLAEVAGIAKPEVTEPIAPVQTEAATAPEVVEPVLGKVEPVAPEVLGKQEPVAPNLPTGTGKPLENPDNTPYNEYFKGVEGIAAPMYRSRKAVAEKYGFEWNHGALGDANEAMLTPDEAWAANGHPKTPFNVARTTKEGVADNHQYSIESTLEEGKPVNATAVEKYGIKLPEGYERQGDLYVKPSPVSEAPVSTTAPPLTEIKPVEEVIQNATEKGNIQENVPVQRTGDGEVGTPAEASSSGGVQPEAEITGEAGQVEGTGIQPASAEDVRSLPTVEAVKRATDLIGKDALEAKAKSQADYYVKNDIPYPVDTPEGHAGLLEQAARDVLRQSEAGVRPAQPETTAAVPQPEQPAPQKPSKIGQSIEAKAVEAKLTQGFAETAGYDPITIKDQAERATNFVQSSPTDARAVLRGDAPLPDGLRGTSVITAMEEHLLKNPDPKLAYELANSPLTSATSVHAQEMRLMQERVPDSLSSKFQEIRQARQAGSKLRGETTEKVAADITKEVVRQASKRPTWEAFVREIVCK